MVLEDLAGSVVEFVFDGQQVSRWVVGEADAFGEVVAKQSVDASLLPRCQGDRESQKTRRSGPGRSPDGHQTQPRTRRGRQADRSSGPAVEGTPDRASASRLIQPVAGANATRCPAWVVAIASVDARWVFPGGPSRTTLRASGSQPPPSGRAIWARSRAGWAVKSKPVIVLVAGNPA
jgi:hypothetical protein